MAWCCLLSKLDPTNEEKSDKPVQRERKKGHVQLSGMRRRIQRRQVGMME